VDGSREFQPWCVHMVEELPHKCTSTCHHQCSSYMHGVDCVVASGGDGDTQLI
jgi:hypothetical protein